MANRKIVIETIRQVQPPGGGGVAVNLKEQANSIQGDPTDAEDIIVRVTLTTDEVGTDFPVRLSVFLTHSDPTGTTDQVQKRHRKSDRIFLKRKRVTPGSPQPIRIPAKVFDEENTIYIIQVRSRDDVAVASCNIHRVTS